MVNYCIFLNILWISTIKITDERGEKVWIFFLCSFNEWKILLSKDSLECHTSTMFNKVGIARSVKQNKDEIKVINGVPKIGLKWNQDLDNSKWTRRINLIDDKNVRTTIWKFVVLIYNRWRTKLIKYNCSLSLYLILRGHQC